MGVVYLATDPLLRRTVAIKMLQGGDDELRERFAREARSAAALRHNNIVTIYDVGEDEGRPFIAMEFVDGESMAELIRRRAPLSLHRRLELIGELCAGLGYAHRNGIVHRDIKPANLMITTEGSLKILDFGLARMAADATSAGLTRAGALMGTPQYMAPEQIEGLPADQASDIFSVGLVLYELLAYRRAFPGESAQAVLIAIVSKPPTPIREYVTDLDPELERLVDRAVEKDRDKRFPSLRALGSALEQIRLRLGSADEGVTLYRDRSRLPTPPLGTPVVGTPRSQTLKPSIPNFNVIAERRAAQIDQYIKAAQADFDAGRYEAAIEQCENAAVLNPDEPRALSLLQKSHTAIEDRQIQGWLHEARDCMSRGALSVADGLIQKSLQLRSAQPDALALQQQVRTLRREQELAAERKRAVRTAIDRALRYMEDGAFEAASRSASEALAFEPQNEEARDLKARATAILDEQRRQREREEAAERAVDWARQLADADSLDEAAAVLRAFQPPHPSVDKFRTVVEAAIVARDRRRQEEEERRRREEEEAREREEARRREEEARRKREEEEQRQREEERRRREEEARRKREEDERRRREEEEARQRAEAEAKRRREEEEARQRAEAEAKRKREEEAARQRAEAEAKRKREEEEARQRAEAEAKRKREEEAARQRAEAEAKRKREEEEARQRAEAEAKRKREEEAARQRAEAEAKRKSEEEAARQRAEAEAKRKREEEEARQRAEAEAKRKREEEEARRRAETEAKRKREEEEARQRAEAEAKRKHEEEAARQRAEAEAKRKREEEAARQRAEAEAKRKREEEEAKRKREEEARKRAEAEATRQRNEVEARKRAGAEAERAREDEAARSRTPEAWEPPVAAAQPQVVSPMALGAFSSGAAVEAPHVPAQVPLWQQKPVMAIAAGAVLALALVGWLVTRDSTPAPAPTAVESSSATDLTRTVEEARSRYQRGDVAGAITTALSVPADAPERPAADALLQEMRREAATIAAADRRGAETAGRTSESAFAEAAKAQQQADALTDPAATQQAVDLYQNASALYRQAASAGWTVEQFVAEATQELQARRVPRAIELALQAIEREPRNRGAIGVLESIRTAAAAETDAAARQARDAGATEANSPAFKQARTRDQAARRLAAPRETANAVDTFAQARADYARAVTEATEARAAEARAAETRAAAERSRQSIQAVWQTAESRLKAGDLTGAASALDQAAKLDPSNPRLTEMRGTLENLRSAQANEQQRSLDVTRIIGEAAKTANDNAALQQLRSGLTKYPGNTDLTDAIGRRVRARDDRIGELLKRAQAAPDQQALALLDEALALDPTRSDLRAERERRGSGGARIRAESEVRNTLSAYEAAYEARNANDFLRVASYWTPNQVAAEFKNFSSVQVQIANVQVALDGDANSANVTAVITFVREPAGVRARPITDTRPWELRLENSGGAWRITRATRR
jgi:hypothetical protein